MTYKVTKFGSTNFPTARATPDVGTFASLLAIVQLPGGGTHDEQGTDQSPTMIGPLRVECLLTAATAAAADTAYQLLRALRGVRDKLYRVRQDTDEEWVYARLDKINATRAPEDIATMNVEMIFMVQSRCWSGDAKTPGVLLASTPDTVICANAGDADVLNAVITITAGTEPLQDIDITDGRSQTNITFSGTIAATKALIIDCGAKTVENDASDAYAYWDLSSHADDEWVRINQDGATITFAYAGGTPTDDGTIAFSYYEGWQ